MKARPNTIRIPASDVSIRLSASDVSNHLACRHLTALDRSVVLAEKAGPQWRAPDLWVLQQRGKEHEQGYLAHLKSLGLSIVNIDDVKDDTSACDETRKAMLNGVDVIAQGALADTRWFGRPDVLRKVAGKSAFGDWSYEVYDCKLALLTKATSILQLSLYSELLVAAQGSVAEFMHVVPPGEEFVEETHRVSDYVAYYRYVKQRLEKSIDRLEHAVATYPEPNEHCAICHWWQECDAQRRKDDHLSLVAGISKLQRKQLNVWGIETVKTLADLHLPLPERPKRGSADGYVRVRHQARIQVEGRDTGKPLHEVFPFSAEHGFHLLPAPSPGDVFFDLEADPFAGRGGREYLFGVVTANEQGEFGYECRWAVTAAEEKASFEWFVDLVMARWAEDPGMHIYQFSGYEAGALKRLMGRHATREDEIDRMLRARLLIDVHTVLKRAVRASVEQYSLKALETFYAFERKCPLETARTAMRFMQHALELGEVDQINPSVLETIKLYNADDCYSTLSLRNWLEQERTALVQSGQEFARPALSEGTAPEAIEERQLRAAELAAGLRSDIPADATEQTEEQAARWLLSNLLDWHRRESKAGAWENFRLEALSDEELLDERSGLGGLQFVEHLALGERVPTDRYRFEKQDSDVRAGKKVGTREEAIGEVVAIDFEHRTVDIKKTQKTANTHPLAVFIKEPFISTEGLADALLSLADWVIANGIGGEGPHRAARDLLLRAKPRIAGQTGDLILPSDGTTLNAAVRIGGLLDHSVLAIQGPPGSGKTYSAARMICDLVRQGKKVGVTATSHKVIAGLLKEVVVAAGEAGLTALKCVQKVRKEDKPEQDAPHIQTVDDNKKTFVAFQNGGNVLAGTQWLFCQEKCFGLLDVLFVDEAGQMSLANVLAVAQSAKSLVLVGDPQQLEQPLRGSHPEGADASALEHLLNGAKTIPSEMGLFIEETRRLHPLICAFTSEVFYESRLGAHAGLENQQVVGHPWLGSNGLWFISVHHEGNQNSSEEEVDVVAELVESFMANPISWIDKDGESRQFELKDILIVAPYNAQVSDLAARIPGAHIGTVDKFQGQQAPVVIYSLATSSPEDAPRGMEFLYSLNRLNVATSRAQGMVIIVGSPLLLEPECHSPRQMQLANALCRFAELARMT